MDLHQLFNDFDERGFNLLLRAAEMGLKEHVENLLNYGFDVNSTVGVHSAASLAYDNGHFDTLLILLNANSKFPHNFNAANTQHSELIAFDELMNEFHILIFGVEVDALRSIIDERPNLKLFFRSDGNSAAYEALSNNLLSSYELLVQNRILLAPDEDFKKQ